VTEVADNELPPGQSPTQLLAKAMWTNISELQMAEQRREALWKKARLAAVVAGLALALLALGAAWVSWVA
jgi:hypothetical protein